MIATFRVPTLNTDRSSNVGGHAVDVRVSNAYVSAPSPGTVDTNSTIPTEWDMIVGNVLLPISGSHADETVTRPRLQRTRYDRTKPGAHSANNFESPLQGPLGSPFRPCKSLRSGKFVPMVVGLSDTWPSGP